MHHLREALQRQGIAVDDWLETLPDRLHQLQASIQGADRRDLAAQLQQWADLLEQPAEEIDLDRIVQLLETKLGGILGMEARKARREEEKRQEYRESARQAIARSLQKHGISPLTGSDVTPKEK
jgi:hypothetical protein